MKLRLRLRLDKWLFVAFVIIIISDSINSVLRIMHMTRVIVINGGIWVELMLRLAAALGLIGASIIFARMLLNGISNIVEIENDDEKGN